MDTAGDEPKDETPIQPLTALMTHGRRLSAEDAQRLARELYGIAGEAEPLHGERNENYRIRAPEGRELILKISGTYEDLDGIDLQIAALDHIARQDPDLPVPRVLATRDGGKTVALDGALAGYRIYAVSALPGRPFEEVESTPSLLAASGAAVARVDRALRGFHHPWVPARLAWDLRNAAELRPAAELIQASEVRRAVEGIYDRFISEVLPRLTALRSQFIHNDAHPANLLVSEGPPRTISGIVDFGDMVHGPLIVDLAVAAADTAREGVNALETAAEVVRGYSGVLPLEEEEIPALYEAILARHATGLAVAAWRTRHDPAGTPLLDRYERSCWAAIEALLSAGRERAAAELRRAARLVLTMPGVRPLRRGDSAAEIEGLIDRRRRLLGPDLELSYEKPLHIVRGEGVWLYDAAGRAYLDVYNNVPQVGHAHPYVVEAVARQAALLSTNTRYLHETVLDYAERLTARMPDGLDVCVFVNSGSEANDTAWRMAKVWTGQGGALVMENAYHGITDAIAALSPYEAAASEPAPHVRTLAAPDVYRGCFGRDVPDAGPRYAEDVDRAIASLAEAGLEPAVLLVDTGFTSNGVLDVPQGYLAAAAEKVRAAGGLLVADEVQYGFGRPGSHFWGFERNGVVPDIVTLGKPIGNGHPLGVVVTRAEILGAFAKSTDFFSTFGGNPASATAGLAVLDVIEREGLQANARTTGAYFRRGLEGLMERHPAIGDVRGSGLLIGVELVRDPKTREPDREMTGRVKNRMRELGVLVGSEGTHGNILKIRPPLPFKPEHADIAVDALDRALSGL